MINYEQLKNQLMACKDVEHVEIHGDGYHSQITVISDQFLGKPKIARQQWVYALLKEEITSGRLHAVQLKTWTKAEWEKQHG